MVLEALAELWPMETDLSLTSHSSMAGSQSQWGGQPGPSPISQAIPNHMVPAKSKGLAPSIPSSVRTRHPVLGAQPASHSLYNACSQGEQQTFCPKPQPPQGRVLPARDSSQEKNHPKGVQHSSRQIFPYQHTRTGVKQQHQSYRGRAWQLQDPCRAIPLLG